MTLDQLNEKAEMDNNDLIGPTTEIVAAYVSKNSVPASELPALLRSVHAALADIVWGTAPLVEPEPLKPAVPIKKSVTDEYIVCLEDGKHFKSLKRHLMSSYGLSAQDYREKWGLPETYPMVAPAYAKARSELAVNLGLGRKRNGVANGEAGHA